MTFRPVLVVVAAIRLTIASWLTSGLPRQFWLMNEKSRCSILFHLLVPGGKWHTEISKPRLIRQPLELQLPETDPRAVAPAAIGGDQQPLGLGVVRLGPSSPTSGGCSRPRRPPCHDPSPR